MGSMAFELLSSSHDEGSIKKKTQRLFNKGDIIWADSDYEKIFPNKFKRRHDLENVRQAQSDVAAAAAKGFSEAISSGETLLSGLGTDVTDQFKAATESELDVHVFLKNGLYSIYNLGGIAPELIEEVPDAVNEKPLKKGAVSATIRSYLKAQLEDSAESEEETEETEE